MGLITLKTEHGKKYPREPRNSNQSRMKKTPKRLCDLMSFNQEKNK